MNSRGAYVGLTALAGLMRWRRPAPSFPWQPPGLSVEAIESEEIFAKSLNGLPVEGTIAMSFVSGAEGLNWMPRAEVQFTLRDGEGTIVPGKQEEDPARRRLLWRADHPLSPETTYELQVDVVVRSNGIPPPPRYDNPSRTFVFKTASAEVAKDLPAPR
jgi:hypothetical protein